MTQTAQNSVFRAARIAAFILAAFVVSACGGEPREGSLLESTLASNANSNRDQAPGQNRNPGNSSGNGQSNNQEEPPEATDPGVDNDPADPIVEDEQPVVGDDGEDSDTDQGGETPVADNDDEAVEENTGADINGYVKLRWARPSERENGESLFLDDIGGYELRYQEVGSDAYEVAELGPEVDEFVFEGLEGSYQFTIAVYDVNGLYSRFVDITPQY